MVESLECSAERGTIGSNRATFGFLRLVCMKIFFLFLPLDYNFCVMVVR